MHKWTYLALYVAVNVWTVSIHDGNFKVKCSKLYTLAIFICGCVFMCIYNINDLQIAWVYDARYLGNYINKSLSDKLDCQQKVSTFIGSVVNLNANFRNLQHDVIARLFKSHCCSFYRSQHGALIHQIINAFVYHGQKCWKHFTITIYYAYLDSWAIVGTASYSLSTATTHLTFFVFNTE